MTLIRTLTLLGLGATLSAQDSKQRADRLRALLESSPKLPATMTEFPVQSPGGDWTLDFVSSLAVDRSGAIYLFQRGLKADPVLVVNRDGRVLRSWGKGLYKIPHSVRIDPAGNVWTVDAASSMIHKFNSEGRQLLAIDVGGLPAKPKSAFCGTTDIAFANGRLFVADGYANNRVLEYRADGSLIREWGRPGTGPGEFNLPHAIAIDEANVMYVGDRENARVQRFTLDGRYLGEWNNLGKPFSLRVGRGNDLWVGLQPHDTANGVECWLLRIDRRNGKILGATPSGGHHSIDLSAEGDPMTGARPDKVLWFRMR